MKATSVFSVVTIAAAAAVVFAGNLGCKKSTNSNPPPTRRDAQVITLVHDIRALSPPVSIERAYEWADMGTVFVHLRDCEHHDFLFAITPDCNVTVNSSITPANRLFVGTMHPGHGVEFDARYANPRMVELASQEEQDIRSVFRQSLEERRQLKIQDDELMPYAEYADRRFDDLGRPAVGDW